MEFKFPSIHNITSTTTTPLPTITTTTTSLSNPTFLGGSSSMVPTPNLSTEMLRSMEALQREVKKDEIRREIMTDIITRRQVLEKEVWNELMLAMQSNMAMTMMLPQPQQPLPETQPAPENKDKFIILAKPDPDLYASKRKAVTPDVEKKSKKWNCSLCQINVTSEETLNMHLQGRKHKAKERALRFQKIGLDAKADEQQSNQTVVDEGLLVLDIKKEEQLEQTNQNEEDSKKPNGTATWEEVQRMNALKRRKIDLWCEICQVVTTSQIVMENHKKGRKHLKRMKNDMSFEQRTIKMGESFANSDEGLSPWLNQVEIERVKGL